MERVGILVVSKCLSAGAMIDALARSERYSPDLYVVEKQANPLNYEKAKVHKVVPDLDMRDITTFAKRHRDKIAFGLTDTEDFVTSGGREALEKGAGVQMICVTRKYAVEASKAGQRLLFDRVFKGANPNYRIFDPSKYSNASEAVADFRHTMEAFGSLVVKPDAPARGAGVGVWGGDFDTAEGAVQFFTKAFCKGRVVVEEKVEGEESSFHAFSDGRHFVPGPMTRDYKRALDGNLGSLTGGMGSYRGPSEVLPFVRRSDYDHLIRSEEAAFRRWKGRGSNPELRGVVLYDAIMHTGRGFKVLERNSRGGNTEFINLLVTMADDFVDVCYRILAGSLRGIKFHKRASVVTCAVPESYGIPGGPPSAPGLIDLSRAYALSRHLKGDLRVYPMDVKLEGRRCVTGTSRAVAVVGLGRTLDEARERSLKGCKALTGRLRWRSDIASPADISKSRSHLRRLTRFRPG